MDYRVIANKFKLLDKIGSGSFSNVYKCYNIRSKEECALKIELDNSNTKLLKHEIKICRHLQHNKGIANCKWYGIDYCSHQSYAIFELLDISLDNYKTELSGKLNLQETIQIGLQLLELIEMVHTNGIIHRDIKPDNFMFGKNNHNQLYIIDFGLSKYYIDNNDQHISFKENKGIIGSMRYISLHIHDGYEASRRDDLISIGYMLIYFLKGRLPWQGLNKKDGSIVNKKRTTTLTDLCSDIPKQFISFIEYCYKLEFDEKPKYEILVNFLHQISSNYSDDDNILLN